MIAYIQGKLAQVEPTFAIVDCHGIGYKVFISLHTYGHIQGKETAKLLTHFVVREDAQLLYGFSEAFELQLFEYLISVSGVGGNTALMMLSSSNPAELSAAIARADVPMLKKIKGVGEKTAARIVLELKDKVSLLGGASAAQHAGMGEAAEVQQRRQEALAALVGLGIAKAVAEKRIAELMKTHDNALTVPELIKLGLRS